MYVAPYLDDFDFWHLYFQTELPSNPTSKRIKTISFFSWRKYRGNWCKIVAFFDRTENVYFDASSNLKKVAVETSWNCWNWKSKLETFKNSELFVEETWIEFLKYGPFKIFKNRCMFCGKVRILKFPTIDIKTQIFRQTTSSWALFWAKLPISENRSLYFASIHGESQNFRRYRSKLNQHT